MGLDPPPRIGPPTAPLKESVYNTINEVLALDECVIDVNCDGHSEADTCYLFPQVGARPHSAACRANPTFFALALTMNMYMFELAGKYCRRSICAFVAV